MFSSRLLITACLLLSWNVLPGTHAGESADRGDILNTALPDTPAAPFTEGFSLEGAERIVLMGGANMESEDHFGHLETQLRRAYPDAGLTLRNLSWEGDTVFQQYRHHRFGEMAQQLAWTGADIVLVQYGQMEIFETEGDLDAFTQAYDQVLQEIARVTRKIVVLPPIPMGRGILARGPNLPARNARLAAYTEAIEELARQHDALFVSLDGTAFATRDGIHLTDAGQQAFAARLLAGLGVPRGQVFGNESALRQAVVRKNHFWRQFYRPDNWSFAYGQTRGTAFGKDYDAYAENAPFSTVAKANKPLLDAAEAQILNMSRERTGRPLQLDLPEPHVHSQVTELNAEEEKAQIKLANPNLQLDLFASEADGIVNPVRMKWDRFGRLWVCCIPSYPQPDPGQLAHDYILICEDTDGDGRADSFKRFVEGIFSPMGLEFDSEGVYVCEGPNLVYYRDADHDGVPESKRIVLSGFESSDTHQYINSITWSHDGRLWFGQGLHAHANVETVHGVKRLHGAGVFRYDPQTGRLETFFGEWRACFNCWGIKSDVFGEAIHVGAAGQSMYDTSAGTVDMASGPNVDYHKLFAEGTKKCDFEFIGSPHFPDEVQGQMWTATFYSSQIHAYTLGMDGGRRTSEQLDAIVPTAPKVFRPLEIKTGPDGMLYVIDWYNEIIGHYQASYRDPRRDKRHGRIWRLSWKGRDPAPPIDFDRLSLNELAHLMSGNQTYARRHARGLLFSQPREKILPLLDTLATSEDPALLATAVGLHQAYGVINAELLRERLTHDDGRLRGAAIMALGQWAKNLPDAQALFETAIADENLRNRVHAAVALSHVEQPEVIQWITRTLPEQPQWTHVYAAKLAGIHTMNHWLPVLAELLPGMPGAEQQDFVFDLAFNYRKDEALVLARELLATGQGHKGTLLKHLIAFGDFSDCQRATDALNLSRPDELLVFADQVLARRWPRLTRSENIVKALESHDAARALALAGNWGLSEYRDAWLSATGRPTSQPHR